VILVRDLVQRFKKRNEKSIRRRIYTAVDHLNFRVAKQSCFGLLGIASFHFFVAVNVEILGANGAGKTTTFRMLINDLKPISGEIIINGRNINKIVMYKSFIVIINVEIILGSRS
jgi:ABC-type multidrug transport system ATPase subunit